MNPPRKTLLEHLTNLAARYLEKTDEKIPTDAPAPTAGGGEASRWQAMSLAPKGCVTEDAGCRGSSEWFLARPSPTHCDGSSPPFLVVRRRSWPQGDSWEGHGGVYYSPDYFADWAHIPAAIGNDTHSNDEWIISAIVALRPFANLAAAFKQDDYQSGLKFTTPNLSPRDFHRAKDVFDHAPPQQELAAIDRYVAESPTVFDRKVREEERDRFIRSLGRKSPSRTDFQAPLQSPASPAPSGESVAVTVWYGEMPESNGRKNYTASLHRKDGCIHLDGFCFARSEYPERVRYEADRVRWIIGELAERPNILAYDADLHSGYTVPVSAPAGDDELRRTKEALEMALARVEYTPGDYPVVPLKHDAFVKEVRRIVADLGGM